MNQLWSDLNSVDMDSSLLHIASKGFAAKDNMPLDIIAMLMRNCRSSSCDETLLAIRGSIKETLCEVLEGDCCDTAPLLALVGAMLPQSAQRDASSSRGGTMGIIGATSSAADLAGLYSMRPRGKTFDALNKESRVAPHEIPVVEMIQIKGDIKSSLITCFYCIYAQCLDIFYFKAKKVSEIL